jgi:predicted RND superfamily exporter protein
VPLVRRLRRDDGESRIWGAIVRGVLRRPVLSALLAGGLLVALALPALQLRLVKPGPETFPQSLPAVQTYERMQGAFPGSALPADVVVKSSDVRAPAMQAAIRRLRQQAVASGRMHEPITVAINDAGTVASIAVPIDGTGTDSVSNASLAQLRDEIVPATVGAVPGAEAGVTGATAQWKDSTDEMKANLPLVVGFVLLLAFSLMLVAFRSPVIALKAIVLNLLSVAAAYGVLALVFQHGYGSDLLGFTPTGGIDPVVPLLLFVILFGLSMDYHVFLLSRIREAVQRGASTEEAVARGITSTAGVVTSAAIVMVGVFAVFATLSMLMFKQFGVGLATAVLIDATIVRGVLLPASMKLLGDWNWYLPRWLRWLPRSEAGGSDIEVATPSRRRRRARRLLPFGVLVVTVLSVAALSPVSLLAGTGNRHERPADASQLERSYEYGIGNFTLDLRDVELPQGTTRIEVELAVGHLLVKVPSGAALDIDGHAAAGKVDLLDETSDGTDVDDRVVDAGAESSAPLLVLEADVGFGRLGVERR